MRVLLVDDHTLFRQGLRTLLEKHGAFQVVGEAEDGRSAVKLVEQLHPDVVVMDIAMKGLNGIEATRQIRQRFSRTPRGCLISVPSTWVCVRGGRR